MGDGYFELQITCYRMRNGACRLHVIRSPERHSQVACVSLLGMGSSVGYMLAACSITGFFLPCVLAERDTDSQVVTNLSERKDRWHSCFASLQNISLNQSVLVYILALYWYLYICRYVHIFGVLACMHVFAMYNLAYVNMWLMSLTVLEYVDASLYAYIWACHFQSVFFVIIVQLRTSIWEQVFCLSIWIHVVCVYCLCVYVTLLNAFLISIPSRAHCCLPRAFLYTCAYSYIYIYISTSFSKCLVIFVM